MIPVGIFFLGISLQLEVLVVVPCELQTSLSFNNRGPRFSFNVSPDIAPRFSKKLPTIPKYLFFSRSPELLFLGILSTLISTHIPAQYPLHCLMWLNSSSSPSLSDSLEMILQLPTCSHSTHTPPRPSHAPAITRHITFMVPAFALTGGTRPKLSDFKIWRAHCEDVLFLSVSKALWWT